MANFLEEQLSLSIDLDSRYSDNFAVDITTTRAGNEYRQLIHPFPARNFTVHFTMSATDLWNDILSLYHRAYGMFAGFRVHCVDDFTTNDNVKTPTAVDEPMDYISSGVYQLQKRYGTGKTGLGIGLPVRTIFKPVAGTVKVAVNSVVVTTGWSVNTTTGRVTFTTGNEPLITDLVTAGCEFDIPCRFNSQLDVTNVSHDFRDIKTIDLIEILNP